ncbi:hypothetical protein CLOHAE12215_00083 [Clostridium haemolyticum]|nr:hypothetical protein CLOHAE12215_00083 [Clostridium haemolyticum]
MILSKKVRLYPTEIQEQKLWQSVGTSRFIYNWTLNKQQENYKNGGKFIKDSDLRKEITLMKKTVEQEQPTIELTNSRKYDMNKKIEGGENRCQYKKTNNIIKLEKEIRLLHRRLRSIRSNHIHQATNKIVKTKPSRVVVELLRKI